MSIDDITHLPLRSRPPRRSLRSWLRDVGREIAHAFECGRAPEQPAGVEVGATAAVAPQGTEVPLDNVVLPFPIRGEALLVRLATALRSRFAERGPDSDPLLLAISHAPQLRLTVDRAAYIEFRHGGTFRLAIEAGPDTTLSLETVDIDIIVGFVTRYIGEKLAESAKFEAAS